MPNADCCECGICILCQKDQETLDDLKVASTKVPRLQISRDSWLRVEQNLPITEKKSLIKVMVPIAASIGFMLVGFLSWQQYQLKADFEKILVMNHLLEERLSKQSAPLYQQVSMNKALYELDDDLLEAKSIRDKLVILAKRKSIIEQYISNEKGESNEFSI